MLKIGRKRSLDSVGVITSNIPETDIGDKVGKVVRCHRGSRSRSIPVDGGFSHLNDPNRTVKDDTNWHVFSSLSSPLSRIGEVSYSYLRLSIPLMHLVYFARFHPLFL